MEFFERILTAADTIRDAAHAGYNRATSFYESVAPQISALVAEARKLGSEQDKLSLIRDRVAALATGARNRASPMLQGALAGATSFVQGMPSRLALQVYELTQIQILADAKGALSLAEIARCLDAIDKLKSAYEADHKIDLEPGLVKIAQLLDTAGKAVDAFDDSEGHVTHLLAVAETVMTGLTTAVQDRAAAAKLLAETIKGATAPTSNVAEDQVNALASSYEIALKSSQEGDLHQAALLLSGWQSEAEALISILRKEITPIERRARRPATLRAQLGGFLDTAKGSGKWDGNEALHQLKRDADAAIDARPCDIAAAELAIQAFGDAVTG